MRRLVKMPTRLAYFIYRMPLFLPSLRKLMRIMYPWFVQKSYKCMSALGLREDQLQEVVRIIRAQKRFWVISTLISVVLPFLDVVVTGSLYLIVSKEKRIEFRQLLVDHLPNDSLSELIYTTDFIYVVFVAAILTVLASLRARYLQKTLVGKLRAHYATENAQNLISQYLVCDARIARELSREKIVSSILNDCGGGEQFTRKLVDLGGAGVGIIIYGAGAMMLAPNIVAVVLAVYFLPFLLTRKVYSQVQKLAARQVLSREGVIKNVRDLSDSSSRVRVDGIEDLVEADVLGVVTKQKWQSYRLVRIKAQFSSIFDGFGQIQLLIVVLLSTVFFAVSIESLLILLIVFAKMSGYLGRITGGIQSLRIAEAKANRYRELIQKLGDSYAVLRKDLDKQGAIVRVSCTNVGFAYKADHPILDGVSLDLSKGDRALLTGGSGAGKTTLVDIFSGLVIPDVGQVMLNQRLFTKEQFYRLRSQIILVSSMVYVFDRSVRYNLTLDIQYSEERLWEALAMVDLDSFVAELPQGLETAVGPDAMKLSVGQRQRLLFARLFLRKPSLALLDEATANLNPSLEEKIINNLTKVLDSSAIVLLVAHKPPPNYQFNRHFVLTNGRLDEQSHSESLKGSV